jgi:RNA polymerase primary sigma factor
MENEVFYSEDPLQVYLREISRIPALDRAEEIRCMAHVRASDQLAKASRTRLIEANLHLVGSLAERFPSDRLHILDLIEKGNNGLLLAVETLRDSSNDSFSDYARDFIERAVAEAIAADSTTTY